MLRIWPRHIVHRVGSVLRAEAKLIASIILVLGSLWVFAEVADEIEDGEIEEIDRWALATFREAASPHEPIGPEWVTRAALDVTSLGSAAVVIIVLLLVVGFLLMQREYGRMWLVIIAAVVAQGLSAVLKYSFGRERPPEVMHLADVATASFPSGHSMVGFVVYLTLGAVLASARGRTRDRVYIVIAALFLSGIIGLSRIYIGVHYATDVLGGWAVGSCVALLCLMVARDLRPAPREECDPACAC